jgi:hypothetical protein
VGGMIPTLRLAGLMTLGIVVAAVAHFFWQTYRCWGVFDDLGPTPLEEFIPALGGAIAGLAVELLLRRKKNFLATHS